MGLIYKDLLRERENSNSEGRKLLIKNVVNFSTGYLGYNANKRAPKTMSYRLVTQPSKRNHPGLIELVYMQQLCGQEYWFEKKYKNPNYSKKFHQCSTLPIYLSVVEFGKLRMSQMFTHIEKYLKVDTFKFLYSNVDNVILTISESCLEDCVPEESRDEFRSKNLEFFLLLPGHFKKEWFAEKHQNWKFASARTFNWALLTDDGLCNKNKNSSYNGVSSVKAYEIALQMLNNQKVSLLQERRENKMLNANKKQKLFQFN